MRFCRMLGSKPCSRSEVTFVKYSQGSSMVPDLLALVAAALRDMAPTGRLSGIIR